MNYTPQSTLWRILEEYLPRDEWIPIQNVYLLVEKHVQLKAEDFLPSAQHNKESKWKRNVRNVLQRRKAEGDIAWNRDGSYLMPSEELEFFDDGVEARSATSKRPSPQLSPKAFEKLQNIREAVGLAGEEWVVEYEQRNLHSIGRRDLAQLVKRESANDIAAGYDVLSFSPNASEKYIEVKTTALKKREFFLTANELRVAQNFGQSYWIYFLSSIYAEEPKLVSLQDPYRKIGQDISLTPITFRARLQRE